MSFSLQNTASRVFLWQRANQVIYLVRNIILARFIAPAEFGLFAIALNLASYIAILGTLEFRTAFFAAKDLTEDRIRVQWSTEVLLNFVTLLIGALLIPWLSQTRPHAVIIAMISILAISLLEASFSTPLYLLERDLRFPFLSALYTVVNLTSFIVCLGIAIAGGGWVALVIDRAVAAGIKGVILYSKTKWRPRFLLRMPELRYYWGFVSILFLTGLLGKVLFEFDIYAIGKWIGPEANGIYSVAKKWALLPMELGAGFIAIMALSLYSSKSHLSLEEFRASYTEITFHITRFCLAIAVLMAIFMKDFFSIFYDQNWQGVPTIFAALVPYAILRPLYQNVSQAMQARKQLGAILAVMFLQSILIIFSMIWLASRGLGPIAGAMGAILGLGYVLLEWQLHRKVGHSIFFIFAFPLLLALAALSAWLPIARITGIQGVAMRVGLALSYTLLASWEWWVARRRFQSIPA